MQMTYFSTNTRWLHVTWILSVEAAWLQRSFFNRIYTWLWCTSCNKKVTIKANRLTANCSYCKLMQEVSMCNTQWIAKSCLSEHSRQWEDLDLTISCTHYESCRPYLRHIFKSEINIYEHFNMVLKTCQGNSIVTICCCCRCLNIL